MAKSSELLALRGKVAGKSFYAMKGVEGTLVRSINEGLSNRVKNDAAYANTRLNAAEFGSAGNFAGALIRTVSKRWRYILKAFSTAAMTKALRGMIQLDDEGAWGQRTVVHSGWITEVIQSLQMMVKNAYEETFANDINVSVSSGTLTAVISVKATDSVELREQGVDGVRYEVYRQVASAPSFDENVSKFTKSIASDAILASADVGIGSAQTVTATQSDYVEPSGDSINCVLVVALPYRTVGGQTYVLQELCSCKWVEITAGA